MRSNNEIINLIQDRIDEKGMSMSELARQVGIAKSTMSRYFNRTREFPLNKTDDFARALGMTPEYLLGIQKVNNIEPEILTIFNQLDEERQENVVDYATVLLNEQVSMKATTVLEKYRNDDYIIDYVEGLVAGGVVSKRKTTSKILNMTVRVTSNDFNKPVVFIDLIRKPVKNTSKEYKDAIENAQRIMGALDVIVHNS